jgi:hypothetical protein
MTQPHSRYQLPPVYFCSFVVAVLLAAGISPRSDAAESRPNVLFIISDDLLRPSASQVAKHR